MLRKSLPMGLCVILFVSLFLFRAPSLVRAAGQGILQSTIIGGTDAHSNLGSRIVLNSSGDILLAGYPLGLNVPTTEGAFDRTFGVVNDVPQMPAYLLRVDALLGTLEGATFYDGTGQTRATDLALDPSGNIVIVGYTTADFMPMSSDAYCDDYNDPDAHGQEYRVFVAKFNGNCTNLIAATYWPRGFDDASVAVDAAGNIFVASKIVDSISGAGVAKFTNDLTTLLGYRKVAHKNMGYYPQLKVCVASENRIYVAGTIYPGTDLLGVTSDSFDGQYNGVSGTSRGDSDGFLSLLNSVDLEIVEATFVGGDVGDNIRHLALAPNGDVVVAGASDSVDLPMRLPCFQASHGDGYIMRFAADLRSLKAATYYGYGNGFSTLRGIAIGPDDSVWITGKYHQSAQLAGYGPHSTPYAVKERLLFDFGDPSDAYVTHLSPQLDRIIASTLLGGYDDEEGRAIALDGDGNVIVMGLTESIEDDDPANPPHPAFPTTVGCYGAALATISVPTPFIIRLTPDLRRPPDPGPTMVELTVRMRPGDALAVVTGTGIDLPGDGDEELEVGTQVSLRAMPQAMPPTWVFDHWESTGDLKGTWWEGSFEIREPTTVVAVFRCTERGGRRSGNTEDPISTASGEFYFDVMDLELGGPMALCFGRQYGSLAASRGLNQHFASLGPNWTHNFDLKVVERASDAVDVIYRDGKRLSFLLEEGVWRADFSSPVKYELKQDEGTWFFLDASTERVFVFEAGGKLTTIMDRSGNSLVLTWSGDLLSSVSDGLGRSLSFIHSEGRIVTVTGGGRSVHFAYDGGILSSSTASDGKSTSYEVDAGGHGWITRVLHPKGNWHTRQTYDGFGRVLRQDTPGDESTHLVLSSDASGVSTSTITNFDGSTTRHVHSKGGLLEKVEEEGGTSLSATYDDGERLTDLGDGTESKMKLAYDTGGEPVAVEDGGGNLRRMVWSDSVESFTDPVSSHGVSFTFRNLTRFIGPDGHDMVWTYDGHGRVIERKEASGHVWSYAYDGQGNLLSISNPLGGQLLQTWNGDGTLATRKDGDTEQVSYTYDAAKRLVRVDRPDGTYSEVSYDDRDRILTSRDFRGSTTEYVYDDNGNVTQWKHPGGALVSWTYDDCDRTVSISNPGGGITTAAYDALNRLVAIDPPGGDPVGFGWNSQRRVVSVSSSDGTENLGAGPSPLTTRLVDAAGASSSIAFDDLGLPGAITDALGRTSRMVRDTWGNVVTVRDPDGRETNLTYDAVGNIETVTVSGLGTMRYERNALGRITRVTDFENAIWDYDYTSMGRIAASTDPLGRSTLYRYDSVGRLRETSFPNGETLTTAYDGGGLPVGRTWSDGPDLSFRYDADGRFVEADAQLVEYDAQGRVQACTSRGERIESTWDAAGRLAGLRCADGGFRVTYTYDEASGRLSTVEDSLSGTRFTFTYDSCGRVTELGRSTGVQGRYTWNAAGELVRVQEGDFLDIGILRDVAGRITTRGGIFPKSPSTLLVEEIRLQDYDQVSQAQGWTYDPRGRLLASAAHTYEWDGASRLLGIDGQSLAYDGCLELITWRNESGTSIEGFRSRSIDGNPVIAQKRGSESSFERYYVYAPDGSLLWFVEPAATPRVRCFHFDDRGDTLALSDENGDVTDRYAYTAYAERSGHDGSTDQPFRFGGRYGVLTSLGHVYMRARWYEPTTGRFLSPDPLSFSPSDPEACSSYAYGANDPINRIDPNGRAPVGGKALAAMGKGAKAAWGMLDAAPKLSDHVNKISLAGAFRASCNASNLKGVGKELMGRLKPNKAQVCSGVPLAPKIAALAGALLFFIPGYSAIDRGEVCESPAQVAWDLTLAGPVATVTVPSAILENIIEAGEANTHGIWNFNRLWEMHQCGVGIEPAYRAFMGALCSYGRDFYVVGYRVVQRSAVSAERATVSVVSYPFKAVGSALRSVGSFIESQEANSRPLNYEHPTIHDDRYYMRGF